MDTKQGLEYTDEGERDFQEDVGGLQRPAIRKDYGKEAGEILKDLEITREIEATNVWKTSEYASEPAKQYEEWTADNVNTELSRPESEEKEIYGARDKVPTEKGRQYTLDKIKNDRRVALANVTRQINKIKPLLSSFSNQKLVRMKVKELDELFALMHGISQNYLSALDDVNEIRQATEWFDKHDKEVFTFKQSIVDYLHQAKEYLNEEFSRSSLKSKYSHSRRSYASGSSNRSQLIQAKAKTASLEAKAAFLKESQAIKMAAEELELKRMIAQAKAEEKVYEQFEHDEINQFDRSNSIITTSQVNYTPTPYATKPVPIGNGSLDLSEPTSEVKSKAIPTSPIAQSTAIKNKPAEPPGPKPSSPNLVTTTTSIDKTPSVMNPVALPFVPEQDNRAESQGLTNAQPSTDQDVGQPPPLNNSTYDEFLKVQKKQANISEMIMMQQVRSSLPSHKPPTFTGDSMEYSRFINAFESLIESKVESPIERLYFLDQYTAGKAKEVIKGCIQMKSDDSYGQAKELLKKHFGDPFKVANAYITKLTKWPSVKAKDGQRLQEYAIALEQAQNATTGLPYMHDLNTAQVLRQLWEKLPLHLRSKWTERASRIRSSQSRNATFDEFSKFVAEQADFATDPVFSEEVLERLKEENKDKSGDDGRYRKGKSTRNFGTNVGEDRKGHIKKCVLCSKQHDLNECEEFGKKTLPERKDLIREKGLCFGCLKPGHISSKCNDKLTCKTCEKKHPSVLHDPEWKSKSKKRQTKENNENKEIQNAGKDGRDRVNSRLTACSITEAGDIPVNMGIVPVWLYHKSRPEKKIKVYALLDNGSGGTFIKTETMERLGIDGQDTTLLLTTMHGTQEIETKVVNGLVVANYRQEDVHLDLPRSYARHQIPTDREEIPRPEVAERFDHLQKISEQLTPYMEDIEVGLLIGLNCPKALRPREVIHGQDTEPYAVRSVLGWYVNGPVSGNSDITLHCNRVHVRGVDESSGCIVTERNVKEEIVPKAVERMFELDFSEKEKGLATSKEDREFLKKVENGIVHRDDSHYEMPLPFKGENIALPNNRPQAEQRLKSLKKRLLSDDKYRQDYVNFMNSIIDKGYATKVNDENATASEGHVWYLPHHGVYHRQKTESLRVVFDCSARYQGKSLNDHLLQGPDLTSKLTGVLIRFREEKIAVMADVEKMFYQVKVTKPDQNYLRFLWWPDSDLTKEPVDYCMTVHLFGGASSPGCSNFALKRTADDHEEEFGSDIADTLRRNFYVDDMLKSVPTEERAIEVVQGTKAMCKKGGFKLTKFVSNSRKVLESVPEEDRAKEIKGLDLGQDKLPVERALGVCWCVESDTLQFRIQLKDQPCTRRGILATISSVYDPLGFIAPVMLVGKKILQDICNTQDWDEPVSETTRMRWEKWRNELFLLENVRVTRSSKPPGFGKVESAQLHTMSDASTTGYGQCSYLRLVDEHGTVHVSFQMGKARVAPKKTVSIPRLELAAATVSVKMTDVLRDELNYEGLEEYYWTDSKVVLGYISNESKRFHVYVANRVQMIQDLSSPSQWRYVNSVENPADEGSRGMTAKQFVERSKWLEGPEFLKDSEEPWQTREVVESKVDATDPEVKVNVNANVVTEKNDILSRLDRFSSLHTAKVAVAICLKYKKNLKEKTLTRKDEAINGTLVKKGVERVSASSLISVEELQKAEMEIIKVVQSNAFPSEIKILKDIQADSSLSDRHSDKKKKAALKKTSALHTLDPFVDSDGILRVGGRIRRANFAEALKTPIILPKTGHFTKLVVKYIHGKTHHSGRGITMNELRAQGYWIINGNTVVRRFISECVTCRRLRGTAGEQKMADLPQSRLEDVPPFTYSAVDYFGPWYVKEGRKEVKRYGALFTCMASRAIHIEIAHSMETDSFIQALRRFICRRGTIRELRSDRGTNLVGAENELKKAVEEMDDGKIKA